MAIRAHLTRAKPWDAMQEHADTDRGQADNRKHNGRLDATASVPIELAARE
jgi:hypothetical protein